MHKINMEEIKQKIGQGLDDVDDPDIHVDDDNSTNVRNLIILKLVKKLAYVPLLPIKNE